MVTKPHPTPGFTRRQALLGAIAPWVQPGQPPAARDAATLTILANDIFSLMTVIAEDARHNWNESLSKYSNRATTPTIDITGAGLIAGILAVYDQHLYPATFHDSAGNDFVLGRFYMPPIEQNIHVAIQPFYCIAPKGGAGWHIDSIGSPHHTIMAGIWKTSRPVREVSQARRAVAGPAPGAVTSGKASTLIVTGAASVNNNHQTPTIDGAFSIIDGFSGRDVDLIVQLAALAPRAPVTAAPNWINMGNEICSTLMEFEPVTG